MSRGESLRAGRGTIAPHMARQKSLDAYEERYRLVFAAGALHRNDPRPNANLLDVLSRFRTRSRCIEFGCGEGFQAALMASHGHFVTAIDISPTPIVKAKRMLKPGQQVDFVVGDMTDASSVNLSDASYEITHPYPLVKSQFEGRGEEGEILHQLFTGGLTRMLFHIN